MVSSWDIYWVTRLDSVNVTLGIFGILLLIASGVVLIFWLSDVFVYKEHNRTLKKVGLIMLVASFIFCVLSSLVPTTKEFAVIYLAPKILNNENIQQLPENTAKLLNQNLRGWLDEKFGDEG